MKCPYLVRQSTTTKIPFYPFDRGNPLMEFIVTSSLIISGIGNGCNKQLGLLESVLAF